MMVLPTVGKNQYLAYATQEKVIGLIKIPLDGNPYRAMGLIAHSGTVSCITSSADGRLIYSGNFIYCLN